MHINCASLYPCSTPVYIYTIVYYSYIEERYVTIRRSYHRASILV